ncbi:response regulator transcription factor [Leptospira jelokensis]|uniref:response regulator transcription factor n=1 Tax=Leptospira jelokensis TaxID=2484931 RepID=UPI001090F4DC|nr:response regulator transcription factor [Leptospira jelokensis]TGM01528.1 DNA-binding response regulator [Leptospira jelokensis]
MSSKTQISVFVIDDHPILRKGLQAEIESDSGFKFVGSSDSIQDGLNRMKFKTVDVLIMDISLKDENGINELTNIKQKFPLLKIIFFTMHRDWDYLQKAANSGADGYVLKTETTVNILGTIKSVFQGNKIFPQEVGTLQNKIATNDVLIQKLNVLSKRELDILHHLKSGKLNREIADELQISIRTVESHRSAIMQKFEIHSTIEFAKILHQLQLSKLI